MHTDTTTYDGPITPREPVHVEGHDTPYYDASIGAFAVATEAYIVKDELDADSLIREADELRALEEQAHTMSPSTSMTADDLAPVVNPTRRPKDLESSAKEVTARAEYFREEKTEELKKVRETLNALDSGQHVLLDEYFNGSAPAFLKAQREKSNATDWATWLVNDTQILMNDGKDKLINGATTETLTNILQWHDSVVRKERERLEPLIDQSRTASFRFATQQYEAGRYARPPRSLDETIYDVQDLFETTLVGTGGFARDNYIAVRQGATNKELRDTLSHENMHVMYGQESEPSWFDEAMTEDESLLFQHGTNDPDVLGVYAEDRKLLRAVTRDDKGYLAGLALRAHTGDETHVQQFKVAFDTHHGTENGFDDLAVAIDLWEAEKTSESDTKSDPMKARRDALNSILQLIDQHGASAGLRKAIADAPVAINE